MTETQLLFVLLGVAAILLGVAGEADSPGLARGARLLAAALGLVVVIMSLLR